MNLTIADLMYLRDREGVLYEITIQGVKLTCGSITVTVENSYTDVALTRALDCLFTPMARDWKEVVQKGRKSTST